MELNNENYFSKEAQKEYCGSTQFKQLCECPAKGMAILNGEWEDPKSTSQLVGSYVDAWMSDELIEFAERNPEIYKRDGKLKSEFLKAEDIIRRIDNDEMFKKYISGEHQRIFIGEIEGLKFKVKADSYFEEKNVCVDMKIVKDFEPIWNPKTNQKENFIDYWKYTWQAAIYCEIIKQNIGTIPKFFIATATKETNSDMAIIHIPEEVILRELEVIKGLIPEIKAIKEGKKEPVKCGHCNYCKENKKITKIINYYDF